MTLTVLAALVAALLLMGVAIFQLALALGAPHGAYAWGGKHAGVLPDRLRIGSALSAPILLAMAVIVLIGGGVVLPIWRPQMNLALWTIFFFMVLNTFANFRSPSAGEKRVMAPVTLAIAICVVVIQVS